MSVLMSRVVIAADHSMDTLIQFYKKFRSVDLSIQLMKIDGLKCLVKLNPTVSCSNNHPAHQH